MAEKRALITGVTGQDGAYLAQLLLRKGYRVTGTGRRLDAASLWRLHELGIAEELSLLTLDLGNFQEASSLLREVQPTEIYNLAAQSSIGASFEEPMETAEVNGLAVARLLEAVRVEVPSARFYQASTSSLFGKASSFPQDESTPFKPCNPYAIAKLYAHLLVENYRDSFGIYACSGILFNHESPLRGANFVTRKITQGLALLATGGGSPLRLGNIQARRDWGYAADYTLGMWTMLQQGAPQDYVLATGKSHTVQAFTEMAAKAAGFDLEWVGERGAETAALDRRSGKKLVEIDPGQFRKLEVERLEGSSAKAFRDLGWKPAVDLETLVSMMVEFDLAKCSPTIP